MFPPLHFCILDPLTFLTRNTGNSRHLPSGRRLLQHKQSFLINVKSIEEQIIKGNGMCLFPMLSIHLVKKYTSSYSTSKHGFVRLPPTSWKYNNRNGNFSKIPLTVSLRRKVVRRPGTLELNSEGSIFWQRLWWVELERWQSSLWDINSRWVSIVLYLRGIRLSAEKEMNVVA